MAESGETTDFSTDRIAGLYHWEEIEGWQMLLQHLDLVDGFALVVVLAPDDWAIALTREHLQETLSEVGAVARVRFDPMGDSDRLAETLLAFEAGAARVVWVDADPTSPDQFAQVELAWQQALSRLNRYRNTIQSRFDCTLALALPARLQRTLREAAPDLWSIRSGVFRIDPPGSSRGGFELLPIEERAGLNRAEEAGDLGDPAVTLAEADKLRGKPGREVLLASLLLRAGNQARNRLDWQTAERALQEAYSLQEKVGGDPDLRWEIATDFASLLQSLAGYERAEYYKRRALEISELHFGPSHPNTAVSLNNLAQLLRATNRLAEAEPLMRRALAIDEESFGPSHPDIARDLSNLGMLLRTTNRLSEAEPLLRRALAIDEESVGPDHPDVAIDLVNLGLLLRSTNRLAEAEPLMRRALEIDETRFGPEHPEVAIDLNNLALLLQDTKRLSEAEPLLRRALAIDERCFGHFHPNVAIRLNNLAQLLQATDRFVEAEALMQRTLAIDEQCYGPEHPEVARDLANLGLLLRATNRPAEAEPLLRRALAIDEQSFGPDHPNVATDLSNLARLLRATGRLEEAESLMRRHLQIFSRFGRQNGHEHPYFQAAVRHYRRVLDAMKLSEDEIARRVREAAGDHDATDDASRLRKSNS